MDKENLNGVPEEETEAPVEEINNEDAVTETEQEEAAQDTAEDEVAEDSAEDEDDEEAVICSVCGENKAAEGSEYCVECEKAMLKKRIPFTGWLTGFAALGFSLVAFVFAVISLIPAGYVILGDSYAKKDNWHMAFEIYMDVPQEAANFNANVNEMLGTNYNFIVTGQKVDERIMDAVNNYYSPIEAYYFAQNFFGESADERPFIKKYEKAYNDNYVAFSKISEILDSAMNGEAEAADALESVEKFRGTEGVNDVFIDYYKFALAYELGESDETVLDILRSLEKSAEATGEDYGWIYHQSLAQTLYDLGEYDEAIVYLDKIIEKNKSSYDAYYLKMKSQLSKGDAEGARKTVDEFTAGSAYSEVKYYSDLLEIQYLRATGNYDEAKAYCVEASAREEVDPENSMINLIYFIENKMLIVSEFYRQSALVDMLQGNYEDAFTSMMEAYKLESQYAYYMSYSPSLNDPKFYGTLYLSAKLLSTNGTVTEEVAADVEYVLSMFEAGTMPESIEAIVNGEAMLEEVLTKGAFDLV